MRCVLIASVLCVSSTTASGGIIAFESFQSDSDAYSPGRTARTPTTIGGGDKWGLGYRFQSAASGSIESIELGAFVTNPAYIGRSIAVAVHADVGGFVGSELGSATMAAQLGMPPLPPAPVLLNPAVAIDLQAGQSYWLTISADVADIPAAWVRWFHGDTSAEGLGQAALLGLVGGTPTWSPSGIPESLGAFRILIPAPAAAGSLALLGVVVASRRRRA